MSYTLGIDSTGFGVDIALLEDEEVCYKASIGTCGVAEVLTSEIVKGIERKGVSWSEISLIGVCTGPGSYTGIRSGIATALGLSYASNTEVRGVPTLVARSLDKFSCLHTEVVVPFVSANQAEVFYSALIGVPFGIDISAISEIARLIYVDSRKQILELIKPRAVATGDHSQIMDEVSRASGALWEKMQQPERIVYFGVDRSVSSLHPAVGVALGAQGLVCAEAGSLSSTFGPVKPIYVKGVNAKTIAERQA